ncbi:hypothetical protein [Uliginosibacterium sp. 31-12]|uniref:hypothetical protein n=1 Tax=Uliginosibacterium sp. 31-12 TaxID=3062781 RepID=UPI0026E2D353|nr:hypothetical protein [Uliginosibacterium sp. 31-12]MDO6385271.1 hypothetical protein [Uliginosibacterium sp. 31-12]
MTQVQNKHPEARQARAIPGATFITPDGEAYRVRRVVAEGHLYFVWADVLRALELKSRGSSTTNLARVVPSEEMRSAPAGLLSGSGMNGTTLVTRKGISTYLKTSRQSNAPAFQAWMNGEDVSCTEQGNLFTEMPDTVLKRALRQAEEERDRLAEEVRRLIDISAANEAHQQQEAA